MSPKRVICADGLDQGSLSFGFVPGSMVPFGTIRYFRREQEKLIAFIVFEKRCEALNAKKALEHSS